MRERMGTGRVAAAVVVMLLQVVTLVFGVSVLFVTDDPFPDDANALIATFAAGMSVLGIGATIRVLRGDTGSWRLLWAYPAFFLAHVAMLGLVLPDGVFAIIFSGCLWALRPSRSGVPVGAGNAVTVG